MRLKDLAGQKFGRLTVISYQGQSKWLCKCECGNMKIICAKHLKSGDTKSCGCLNKKQYRINLSKNHYTHRQSSSRLYKIWKGIKDRCLNKNTPKYSIYGARGIIIYKEWLDDFMNFYNWAMANGYNDSLTIDRINVNGNYEPSNCRWVNQKIQQRNRRNNHLLTYMNETHCISEWAEIYNIKPLTLLARISRGWDLEKALNTNTKNKGD